MGNPVLQGVLNLEGSRTAFKNSTGAPELNLVEVRWMWMQRMDVNNSIFENESDIGEAVSDWTKNYNMLSPLYFDNCSWISDTFSFAYNSGKNILKSIFRITISYSLCQVTQRK